MAEPSTVSPGSGTDIRAGADCGRLRLRAPESRGEVHAAIEHALGTRLPEHCGEVTSGPHGVRVAWLGPGEWWVLVERRSLDATRRSLEAACAGLDSAVVEDSAGYLCLELVGIEAARALSGATAFDLEDPRLYPGSALRTRVADVGVVIERLGPHAYVLHVPRSYARHVSTWLEADIDAHRATRGSAA